MLIIYPFFCVIRFVSANVAFTVYYDLQRFLSELSLHGGNNSASICLRGFLESDVTSLP